MKKKIIPKCESCYNEFQSAIRCQDKGWFYPTSLVSEVDEREHFELSIVINNKGSIAYAWDIDKK